MHSPRYHVIFDLDHCRETIQDKVTIDAFIRALVDAIGMRIVGGPLVCEGALENPGLSGFAVIDTSHVSVHTFTAYQEAMIDVFSCKAFDKDVVRTLVLSWFATASSTLRAELVHWETPEPVVEPLQFDYRSAYMEEYYQTLTQENLDIGQFLMEAVREPRERFSSLSILDAGCGPTLSYWMPFFWPFDAYHGLDGRADNIDAVRGHVEQGKAGEIPLHLVQVCRQLDTRFDGSGEARFFRALCERVGTLSAHDMQERWPYADRSFQVVVSLFGIECMEHQQDMLQAFQEARRLLEPGGRLICVSVANTNRWKVGPTWLRCVPIRAEDMERLFQQAGFGHWEVRLHPAVTAREQHQGYAEMIFAFADR